MVSRDKKWERTLPFVNPLTYIRIFSPLKLAFCQGSAGLVVKTQKAFEHYTCEWAPPAHVAGCMSCWSAVPGSAHAEYEMLCHELGLVPSLKKDKENICLSVLFSIFCPLLSLYTPPNPLPFPITAPPLTLTLASLSGLLPCIPPFPVWPLSQEVAQLVDKHHGGDGEEGLDNSRPPASMPVLSRQNDG